MKGIPAPNGMPFLCHALWRPVKTPKPGGDASRPDGRCRRQRHLEGRRWRLRRGLLAPILTRRRFGRTGAQRAKVQIKVRSLQVSAGRFLPETLGKRRPSAPSGPRITLFLVAGSPKIRSWPRIPPQIVAGRPSATNYFCF